MQQILALTPSRLAAVRGLHTTLAHVAYRIGGDGRLWAASLPPEIRGGWMMLEEPETAPISRPESAAKEIVRECIRRRFAGVIADFEAPPTRDRAALLRLIGQQLPQGLQLWVPETFGSASPRSVVLISTAISGGSLHQRLEEAIRRWGVRRVALDGVRLRMDFTLPAPSGEGQPLCAEEFSRLRQGQPVYFSPELCARYFTYRSVSQVHFVLFDDAETLRRKAQTGASLGLEKILYMLPEVEDLLDALFTEKQKPYPKV